MMRRLWAELLEVRWLALALLLVLAAEAATVGFVAALVVTR